MLCFYGIMQILHYPSYMDILLFRDLERLHQTGNFSQAAALGNISQPAFSRRIKALEAWVGTQLVERSRQPVRLTEAGTQMLGAGLQALSRIEHERSQILEALSLPDKYVVTFAAQHSIGWRFYPAWLQALEDTYGPILSRLRADDLPNCMRDLENGDVDFVIAYERAGIEPDSTADSIVIGDDQLIPVCKPDARGAPLFGFESKHVSIPFLRFGDSAPIGAHLKPLFAKHQIGDRLHTVYENSMAGALRIRAGAGDGVAWLPRSLVRPDLERGILVRTGEPTWVADLSIHLFRNKERTNRLTRSLWSFLEVRQSVFLVSAH